MFMFDCIHEAVVIKKKLNCEMNCDSVGEGG